MKTERFVLPGLGATDRWRRSSARAGL